MRPYIWEDEMTLKISDVKWSYASFKPVNGHAEEIKGDILAATFTCTCGQVWSAHASQGLVLAPGYFARTNSSITVDCPGCNLRWNAKRDEYVNL